MLRFDSDYMEGCVPEILRRLSEINFEKNSGYGTDTICESAKEKIRKACSCPDAEIYFLVGGTQANSTVIDALLQKYEAVIAAKTGHIACHEAGAVEACGHKVIELAAENGKLTAAAIRKYAKNFFGDSSNQHMPQPSLVYISLPTEYGTLYSLSELKEISSTCREFNFRLFVDGARLGYGLAAKQNDISLEDLAQLTDAFYIGGTKVGALFGEAVVFPKKGTVPHFFTQIKQNGALLAKGWLLGVQFDELFTDGLYFKIAEKAVKLADQAEEAFRKKGYEIYIQSPTNQKFIIIEDNKLKELEKKVSFSFWEKLDDGRTVVRFATSWATTQEDIESLEALL